MMLYVNEIEDLADFIRRRLKELNLSTYDVAKASGNRISPATITKIVNREIKTNSLQTLEPLADGLGVPPIQMFRIAQKGYEAAQRAKREVWIEAFGGEDLMEADIKEIEKTIEFLIQQKLASRREELLDEMIERARPEE
jgi:transcriptional regulator with XRE-family HTH domain